MSTGLMFCQRIRPPAEIKCGICFTSCTGIIPVRGGGLSTYRTVGRPTSRRVGRRDQGTLSQQKNRGAASRFEPWTCPARRAPADHQSQGEGLNAEIRHALNEAQVSNVVAWRSSREGRPGRPTKGSRRGQPPALPPGKTSFAARSCDINCLSFQAAWGSGRSWCRNTRANLT